jgi:8-oxo-dGTP diphosphatase
LLGLIACAIRSGADGVQLRQKQWSEQQWLDGLLPVQSLCEELGVALILNSPPQALAGSADGLHLTGASLGVLAEAGELSKLTAELKRKGRWLSASCHDERELALAQQYELDWVSLSPVAETLSHAGQPALGWGRFKSLVKSAELPVYALGGMTLGQEARARACGAQGIAAIRTWST